MNKLPTNVTGQIDKHPKALHVATATQTARAFRDVIHPLAIYPYTFGRRSEDMSTFSVVGILVELKSCQHTRTKHMTDTE